MNQEQAEKITEEFFKRRFPDKDIEFEKKCGYFDEWVKRFQNDYPEGFMDEESFNIWQEMKEGKLIDESKYLVDSGHSEAVIKITDCPCECHKEGLIICDECDTPEKVKKLQKENLQ